MQKKVTMNIKQDNISFDHCIKCTVCTIYCPVARETHLYPGPKFSGPDAERLRIKNPELVDSSLAYCSNCKRCEVACPSDVEITDLINTAKAKYLNKRSLRLRDFFISRTDLLGKVATSFSSIVNFLLKIIIVKFFMDFFLKIPYKVSFPSFAKSTFSAWFNKNIKDQGTYPVQVTYFHGCYVNYYNHELGKDLVKVMNALHIGVSITKEKCCGVPLIANGYMNKAKKNAVHNTHKLHHMHSRNNGKIISTSSSCSFALKHEYPNLLQVDNSAIVNDLEYITKYLYDLLSDNDLYAKMRPVNLRAAYHAPCHLERLGGVIYTTGLLKKIPGLELVILHSECCGIAGTYGFKKEYHSIAVDVGSALFKRIEDVDPEVVITDCETCAMQIEMNTEYKVLHPVNILARALLG